MLAKNPKPEDKTCAALHGWDCKQFEIVPAHKQRVSSTRPLTYLNLQRTRAMQITVHHVIPGIRLVEKPTFKVRVSIADSCVSIQQIADPATVRNLLLAADKRHVRVPHVNAKTSTPSHLNTPTSIPCSQSSVALMAISIIDHQLPSVSRHRAEPTLVKHLFALLFIFGLCPSRHETDIQIRLSRAPESGRPTVG